MNPPVQPRAPVLVAQIGARRHYAVPRAFAEAGVLAALHTDACADAGGLGALARRWPPGLPPARLARLRDRRVPGVPAALIRTHEGLVLRAGLAGSEPDGVSPPFARWARQNRLFGEAVVRAGFGAARSVYGFNGAALEILRAARERGLGTALDQTSCAAGFEARVAEEERRRWPGWEPSAVDADGAGREALAVREREERALADRIVCGSAHVASTLAAEGVPAGRLRVVPYGIDAAAFACAPRAAHGGPLRVLCVGRIGLMKGLPYLVEALRALPPGAVECRCVGPAAASAAALARVAAVAELAGAAPRSAMRAHYQWADVLVLPTLAEGSANVGYEALAAGLPVVATPNAGTVVEDGVQGFIVPARDAAALAARLGELSADRAGLARRSAAAVARAAECSPAAYARNLVAAALGGEEGVRP